VSILNPLVAGTVIPEKFPFYAFVLGGAIVSGIRPNMRAEQKSEGKQYLIYLKKREIVGSWSDCGAFEDEK
jgi:hypothetical protein